jgi:hypothetical protein
VGGIITSLFAVLTDQEAAMTLAAMPRTAVTLIVFALLAACSLAGGGFFDGHGALL